MITLGYGRMLQDGLDGTHGLPRARLTELARRFGAVQAEVRQRRQGGDYGFYDLVDQAETVRGIRAFATTPLRLRNGHLVGNLCFLGTQPRTFRDSDRELLESLASQFMESVEPATSPSPVDPAAV